MSGITRWSAVLLPLLLAVAACATTRESGAPVGSGERENTVRALLPTDPASLTLIGKADRNTDILAVQITDSLVQYDSRLKLQPRVAESFRVSPDRLEWTFVLRDGVRWHDGRPVTADDVVFTVDKVREPAVENRSYGALFRDLESVVAVDARTVRARYRVASPQALDAWRLPLLPRHLAGRDPDLLTGEFARHPVGCGPFRFVSYEAGREVVLEANPDYWDGRPSIDRLVFRIFPDQRTAYQALLTGEIDLVVVTSSLWAEARASGAGARLESFLYSTLSVWPVVWNQDGSNPFFVDPRVRRAMTLALDRQAFIDGKLYGAARPGVTFFHPETVWFDASLSPYPYDPDAAGRLLDEAGWIDRDGDGMRERDGRPFRFTLLLPASPQALAREIAVWQQDSWRRIGVRAEIEQLEWQAFRERRNAGRFDAVSYSLSYGANPDELYDLFHSSAREGGSNFYGLSDPELDRLFDEGRGTFDDDATRFEIYRAAQRRLHELEPMTCTFHLKSPVLHDRRLHGVTPSLIDFWRTTEGPRVWSWESHPPGPGAR